MPRFVLLYHDCPPGYARPSHWDFMMEAGDVLRTWALEQLPQNWTKARAATTRQHPQCPSLAESNEVAALQLGEHRRDYLEIEGSLRGDRGSVVRVAAGDYASERESCDEWRITLSGDAIAGRVVLRRSVTPAQWTLECLSAC